MRGRPTFKVTGCLDTQRGSSQLTAGLGKRLLLICADGETNALNFFRCRVLKCGCRLHSAARATTVNVFKATINSVLKIVRIRIDGSHFITNQNNGTA